MAFTAPNSRSFPHCGHLPQVETAASHGGRPGRMATELSCLIAANRLDQVLPVMRPGGCERTRTMLRDDINNAVKDAMRAKDERRLSTLRMVNSTSRTPISPRAGEGKPPLTDADLLGVFQENDKTAPGIRRTVRQGRPFRTGRAGARGDRDHLRLPAEADVSEDDVKAAIAAAIAETNAAGMKDMGKVIGVLRAKYAGQMDFGKASGMVKAALTG